MIEIKVAVRMESCSAEYGKPTGGDADEILEIGCKLKVGRTFDAL